MFSPGLNSWRSRKMAITSTPATVQAICVSAPVGSTTFTSALTPPGRTVKCSGRTPMVTSCPSRTAMLLVGMSMPGPRFTTMPLPLRRTVPRRKFMAGDPMKPATNRLAGLS